MASTLASHQVKVTVVEAQNVMRTNDWNEGSDAYCEIKLHGKAHEGTPLKTSTQKQSLSPKWNETFTVELSHSPMNDTIEIFCYGEKVLGKLFIGRVEIPVTLLLHGAMVDGWFKLLPLSVADLSKTVQGHLHLILHYSQVQVPVPAKPVEKSVKKPSTTSASVYPGTTSSMVDCPICSRSFSALAINAHLDICTQTPAPPPSKQPQQQKSEVRACPVCCKTYPVADLNRHVEQCLASQPATLPEPKKEKKKKKKKSIRGPASESEENAQLQAVLIASKLEAEKNEKEKRRETPTETPYIVDTPPSSSPSSGYQPFYPSVPFMPYPATGVPPAAPYVPYGLPTQPTDPSTDGQQPPLAYFPPMPMGMPMYPPPFYGAPTQPPMMPYAPMMPTTSSPTTPMQPKNENLLL